MAIRYNPLIFSGLDLTGGAGVVYWASPVATEGDLPIPGGQDGEARVVQDTDRIYIWDASTSKWIDTEITLATFGGTSAEGLTTSTSTSGDITHRTLQLNEASSTTPGAVSTGTQSFAGEKTFGDLATASSGVETDSIDSIAGGAGVLSVGVSNASTINIGDTGVNVNLYGNTFYQEVTNLEVTDKQVTLNKNGAPASAFNSGIELEEGGSITGYVSTSGDRASWELKPPGVAGTATISPGAAGITIDQSSHDPVTLSAVGSSPNADGATLTNQVLNLEPADATHPGVITAGTQTIGGAKTLVDELTASGGIYYAPAVSGDWPAPAPSQIAPAIDELASRFTNQNTVTKEPTGYPNRTDSSISFDDLTREFTIQPTGVSFDFYIKGQKFTKTTAQTIVIPNSPGDHYIYFDATGNLASTQVFTSAIITDYVFTSIVYWNTDTSTHTYFAEERHGLTMDGVTHAYLHTIFGARYLSGLALQGFTIGSGGSNADAQFTSDQGSIRDEDILHVIAAQAQIPILYRQGQQWRKKAADAYPVIYSGSAGYVGANGRLPYNQYTGGAWQLTQIGNSEYVLVHFFGTNDVDNPLVGIQGINAYNSVASARTGANAEITSLSGLPFAEFVPVGSVIFESANSFGNTVKARVYPADTGADYVDFRGTQLYTPAGEATTHGLLSGLNSDDHIQYLLVDGTRAMSGALDMGNHTVSNMADGVALDDAVTLQQLQNAVTNTPATFAGFDDSGVLAPIPGWTFDDTTGTQIGAQNSLVVPNGVTDYTTLLISPTVSYTGLNNLQAIQMNPAIDQPVQSMTMFQSYGYGMSAPVNFTSFSSNPGFSGGVSNLTHFSIDGSVDATNMIGYNYFPSGDSTSETAFQASSSGNTTDYVGVSVAPSGTSTNFTAFNSTPLGNTVNYTGVNISPQNTGTNYMGVKVDGSSTYTNVTGVEVDLSNITSPNRKTGLSINDGVLQQNVSFTTTSNIPTLVDSCNLLRPTFTVESGSPITGTDVLMNNLAGFIQIDDNHSGSPLSLGISSVGFVSQLSGSVSAVADTVSMLTAGFAVDTGSTGGTIDEAHIIRGVTLSFGGTLTINNLYGFRLDSSFGNVATNTWGISVEDPNAENYLAKSLVIGGSGKITNDGDIALEIQDPKMVVVGQVTAAQRNAFNSFAGAIVFDLDDGKLYYNDSSNWVRVGLPTGDIDQTTSTAFDNTVTPTATGIMFSNAVVRGFEAQVSITRNSTYAEYTLKGIQKGSSWEMSQDYIGDDTGVVFSIDTSGNVLYTSSSTGFDATLSYRAESTLI